MYVVSVASQDRVVYCCIDKLFYTLRSAKRFYDAKSEEVLDYEGSAEVTISLTHTERGKLASTAIRRRNR